MPRGVATARAGVDRDRTDWPTAYLLISLAGKAELENLYIHLHSGRDRLVGMIPRECGRLGRFDRLHAFSRP